MAIYTFETIASAQAASYLASTDTLQFATPGANPWQADLLFDFSGAYVGSPQYVDVTLRDRSVEFGFGIHGSQAVFPDGSVLFIGCPFRDDWWSGSPGADAMYGVSGDDSLVGLGGADHLLGGDGQDTLVGGQGDDLLEGGDGNDRIDGGGDFNRVNGNRGNDTIVGSSQVGDWLLGGQGDDLLRATSSTGHNIMNGNLGNDTIIAGSGGDTLRGGQGDDVIQAGSGADWLAGDLGNNTLDGGQGPDTFHAGAGHDYVSGWHAGDHVQAASGVTGAVSQVNADVHITFSTGGEMELLNTEISSLQPGWFVSA